MSYEEQGSIRRARGWLAMYLIVGLAACTADDHDPVQDLGEVTQASCGCGAQIAVLDGVPAYSNGTSTGTGWNCNNEYYWGGRYQCVEYARRYLCERNRWGGGPTDCYMMPSLLTALGDARACRICDLNDPHLEIHWLYDGYIPQHGDLLVQHCNAGNNNIGHVAVIDTVSGGYFNWTLGVVEQNKSCTGRSSYAWNSARCIVRWK